MNTLMAFPGVFPPNRTERCWKITDLFSPSPVGAVFLLGVFDRVFLQFPRNRTDMSIYFSSLP